MALSSEMRTALAEELWDAARAGGKTIAPSRRFADFTIDDGYAVGTVLTERRTQAGDLRAGLKIGFTNTAVWSALGLDLPICAPIYRESVLAAEQLSGAAFDIGRLVEPRIEPEIVFGLGTGVIDWWALGFEIVQCHYPGWELSPADAIADFGLHGALIVGEPRLFTPQAAATSSSFSVELARDGVVTGRGEARNVLGGPLRALEALVDLADRIGMALPAPGEIITTGSLTAAPFIAPGETWEARLEGAGLPSLRVAFA